MDKLGLIWWGTRKYPNEVSRRLPHILIWSLKERKIRNLHLYRSQHQRILKMQESLENHLTHRPCTAVESEARGDWFVQENIPRFWSHLQVLELKLWEKIFWGRVEHSQTPSYEYAGGGFPIMDTKYSGWMASRNVGRMESQRPREERIAVSGLSDSRVLFLRSQEWRRILNLIIIEYYW